MSRQPLATNAAGSAPSMPGTLSAAPPCEASPYGPATFTILRPSSGQARAEQIRDVIDAFRRLRESIGRFNRLFVTDAGEPPPRADSGASLQPLLTVLARRVDGVDFTRRSELKRAIRDARRLDKTRDALFSDTFCLDTEAMRQTVAELERLDTAFVRLGIGYVLAQHLEGARVATSATVATVDTEATPAEAIEAGMQRNAA